VSAIPRQGDRQCLHRRQAVQAFRLLPGVPPPTVLRYVVSASQLDLELTPDFTAERPRSYAFGICGVVSSVPLGATPANLQAHFAPLRLTSCVHADRCRLTAWDWTTGWLPCFRRENREKPLPYSFIRLIHDASIVFQALQALDSTCTFSTAPTLSGLGAVTGLSSQRGLWPVRCYPDSPHARPIRLEHLLHRTEAYLAVCDNAAILSSTASATFSRLTGGDSHPIVS